MLDAHLRRTAYWLTLAVRLAIPRREVDGLVLTADREEALGQVGSALAEAGVTVISGLAAGVDTEAMLGALEAQAGGRWGWRRRAS